MGGGRAGSQRRGPETGSICIIFLNQFKKEIGKKKSSVSVLYNKVKKLLINHSRQC